MHAFSMITDFRLKVFETVARRLNFTRAAEEDVYKRQVRHTSFKPGEIWTDNNGVHINAHGGGILYDKGTYYWYGEHKAVSYTHLDVYKRQPQEPSLFCVFSRKSTPRRNACLLYTSRCV